MKRKEQIEKAAKDYCLKYVVEETPLGYDSTECNQHMSTFKAGVKWADSHPQWRKYPDDKPIESKEYNVLYCNEVTTLIYNSELDKFCQSVWDEVEQTYFLDESLNSEVTAWIELPMPPKFD